MRDADLLRLAQIYGATLGISAATVSSRATGGSNLHVFERLAVGRRIQRRTRAKLSEFFRQNWPPYTPWPDDVQPRWKRCRGPADRGDGAEACR